jgi:BlaI family penicillinase repressor
MAAKPRHVTDAELSILQVLWEHSAATIRDITDRLYPGGTASDYATVKKLLARLEAKQCVTRDNREMTHRFSASISKNDLIGHRLNKLAEDLCEGSATPLLMHLLEGKDYTARQRRELHDLVDQLVRSKSKRRK